MDKEIKRIESADELSRLLVWRNYEGSFCAHYFLQSAGKLVQMLKFVDDNGNIQITHDGAVSPDEILPPLFVNDEFYTPVQYALNDLVCVLFAVDSRVNKIIHVVAFCSMSVDKKKCQYISSQNLVCSQDPFFPQTQVGNVMCSYSFEHGFWKTTQVLGTKKIKGVQSFISSIYKKN